MEPQNHMSAKRMTKRGTQNSLKITPQPGLEPGSKAPEASRISTTLLGPALYY